MSDEEEKIIKKKLTKRVVDEAQATSERYTIRDTEIPGYGLRILPSGRKSYILDYRDKVSSRRHCATIGDAAIITPDYARSKALEMKREIADGKNPIDERTKQREVPLFKDFVEEYFEKYATHEKKQSSISSDRGICDCHLIPKFGTQKVNSITANDVKVLHQKITTFSPISEKPAPIAANHAVKLLSKMMNLCEEWGYRDPNTNPCAKIEYNPSRSRKRFLSPEKQLDDLTGEEIGPGELERFLQACSTSLKEKQEHPRVIFLLLTILATGARRGEIQMLKKDEVKLNQGVIIKKDHKGRRKKQEKDKTIDLNSLAILLLRHVLLNHTRPDCDWVFESHKRPGKPYNNLHKPKTRLLERAAINDFRIHDMRHTFTSLLFNSDTSVEILMGLLGHSDYQTTKNYIHSFGKRGSSKAEVVAEIMNKYLELELEEKGDKKVVEFKR